MDMSNMDMDLPPYHYAPTPHLQKNNSLTSSNISGITTLTLFHIRCEILCLLLHIRCGILCLPLLFPLVWFNIILMGKVHI